MTVRTRIAPSPTGIAHVGTIYTALLNYAFAKQNQGKFIVRIEDTDRERYVPGAEAVIFEALRWLGIVFDEGPDIGGPFAPYTQSQRLNLYREKAEKLVYDRKAYYCFCSPQRLLKMRQAQKTQKKLPMYDGKCKRLDREAASKRAKQEKHVIRLDVPETGTTGWNDRVRGTVSFENSAIDDQILLKSDGFPTYHLAVVVDDHLMEISHVIRAEEWISPTPKHILLYQAFGWKLPEFAHTPLLRNPDRSKLSKRRNPVSILWYREQGFLPEAMLNFLSLMGWSHPQGKEKFSLDEFVRSFSLDRIKTSQPIFDLDKLRWLNGLYIREKSQVELAELLVPFLPAEGKKQVIRSLIPLIRERIHTLAEANVLAGFFFVSPEPVVDMLLKQSKRDAQTTRAKLEEVVRTLEPLKREDWNPKRLEEEGKKLLADDWKAKPLFMTIRVALTGREVSPPLFESIEILGKKETLTRLRNAANILK